MHPVTKEELRQELELLYAKLYSHNNSYPYFREYLVDFTLHINGGDEREANLLVNSYIRANKIQLNTEQYLDLLVKCLKSIYGITLMDLKSQSRRREMVKAREFFCAYVFEYKKQFGEFADVYKMSEYLNKDRTAIKHTYVKNHLNGIETDESYKNEYEHFKLAVKYEVVKARSADEITKEIVNSSLQLRDKYIEALFDCLYEMYEVKKETIISPNSKPNVVKCRRFFISFVLDNKELFKEFSDTKMLSRFLNKKDKTINQRYIPFHKTKLATSIKYSLEYEQFKSAVEDKMKKA